MIRRLSTIFLCSLALTFAACGDDDPIDPDAGQQDTGGGGGGTGNDTGGTGSDVGGGGDRDTTEGGVCDYTCTRSADCAGSGIANAQCVDGCCTAGTTVASCTEHLGACSSDAASNRDFVCDVEAGTCLARCDAANVDDTQSGDCPLNSYCFDIGEDFATDEYDGICIPGDCDTNIFDVDACGGEGTCLPVANGASFCIDAGTALAGDACGRVEGDSRPASDVCSTGLMCFQGFCEQPCNLRGTEGACGEGDTCLRAFDITARNQPGVCGVACDAFSDSCGEDQFCGFATGRFNITTWMCFDFGAEEIVRYEGESCRGSDDVCDEGLICLSGTCTPFCDPSGNSSQAYGSCGRIGATTEPGDCEGSGEGSGEEGCDDEGDDEGLSYACVPSRLDGFGFCMEECTPYPRRPGAYDCSNEGDVCIPFLSTDRRAVAPTGFCDEETGEIPAGGTCSRAAAQQDNPPASALCADYNLCDALEDGGPQTCVQLCEPFAEDSGCADGDVCLGVLPLQGILQLSLCVPAPQPARIGDRCQETGMSCADDMTICLDTGTSDRCIKICRIGFDDCSDVPDTSCEAGLLNPDVVPDFMGLCI